MIAGTFTGIAPWEAVAILPGPARAWRLITMVAIIQPEFDGAFGRGVQRIHSTLLGVIAVIGLGLGTLFRFWSYRRWVFPAVEPVNVEVPVA